MFKYVVYFISLYKFIKYNLSKICLLVFVFFCEYVEQYYIISYFYVVYVYDKFGLKLDKCGNDV